MPQRGHRGRGALVRWLTALVVLVLGACSGPGPDIAAAPSPTPPAPTLPPPRSVEPATVDEELANLLLSEPPAGFESADPGDYQIGPLDLEAAAASEIDREAERALLMTRGFERGYSRVWTRGEDVVLALVYRFGTADGAEAYMTDGLELAIGRGAEPFAVASVEGAEGFSRVEDTEEGPMTVYAVVFTRDVHFFLLLASTRSSGLGVSEARELAERQSQATGRDESSDRE